MKKFIKKIVLFIFRMGNKFKPFLEEKQRRMAESELLTVHFRNYSVYGTTIKTIDRGVTLVDDCGGYIMPREHSININDLIDFDFVEFLYKK